MTLRNINTMQHMAIACNQSKTLKDTLEVCRRTTLKCHKIYTFLLTTLFSIFWCLCYKLFLGMVYSGFMVITLLFHQK